MVPKPHQKEMNRRAAQQSTVMHPKFLKRNSLDENIQRIPKRFIELVTNQQPKTLYATMQWAKAKETNSTLRIHLIEYPSVDTHQGTCQDDTDSSPNIQNTQQNNSNYKSKKMQHFIKCYIFSQINKGSKQKLIK